MFSLKSRSFLVGPEKSRRNGMAPAHAMVFLSQKPGTEDWIILPTILFLAWVGSSPTSPMVGAGRANSDNHCGSHVLISRNVFICSFVGC